ncbi:MAG: AAA family ATPase [Actinomycetota bacterium]|nr:AAA family ATPase [Actinomycetota bacterium]
MLIRELDIRGFGRLNAPFVFEPGLNLIVGANESGKSTLHDALLRALFGFTKGERAKYGGRAKKDERHPWDGLPFGLIVELEAVRWKEDEERRRLRAEWDFDAYGARVWLDGDEITSQVLAKGNEIRLGEHLLGIGLEEFRQSCTLDQERVEAVKRSDGLTNALTKAVESGSGDIQVEDAVSRMAKFLESLGVTPGALKPAASGSYAQWTTERERLEGLRARYEEVRPQIAEVSLRLTNAEEKQRKLEGEWISLGQRLLVSELGELAEKLATISRLRETERAQPAAPATLAGEVVNRIELTRVQLRTGESQLPTLEAEAEAARPRLAKLRLDQRQVEADVALLAAYEETDSSALDEVGSLWQQIEALSKEPAPKRVQLGSASTLEPARARVPLLVAAGVVAVLSLALATLVAPILATGLLIAAALAYLGLRREAQDGIEQATTADEALRESGARERLEQELAAALDRVGAPRAGLGERASAYLVACRKHTDLLQLRVRLGKLQAEITKLAQPDRELSDKRDELESLEERLKADYGELGIDEEDLKTAARRVEMHQKEVAKGEEQVRQAEEATKQIALVLAGRTEAQLNAERDDLTQKLREHCVSHGDLGVEPGDPTELRRDVQKVNDKLGELSVNQATDRERLEHLREEFMLPPTELREKLSEAESAVAAIEETKEAIRIAREALIAAGREARKNFRPVLEEALSDDLPLITDGRYAEVEIDDELNVFVIAPETGLRVAADSLSRGTQDQIFLVQRLAIANLLDRSGGIAPLLLDDPFAHFDRMRLKLGLKLLDQAAETRQVILFSEDEHLLAPAQEICSGCNVIELPTPTARAATVEATPAAE